MSGIILDPRGSLAKKHTLVMSPRQVTWFIDPQALLRHLADLSALKIAAYCAHCYEKGLPEEVSATFNPETRSWTVHCACADYPPIVDRGRSGLTIDKPATDGTLECITVESVDALMFRLGWSFKCVGDCARLGMADGIEGNNDYQTKTVKLRCGCTERIYSEPGTA